MRWGGVASTSVPSMAMAPARGRISPEITRISVVFPAPLGPITPTASPALTSRLTPNNAWKLP